MPTNERTSESVASVAGRILNGKDVKAVEDWLETILTNQNLGGDDQRMALKALRLLVELRTLSASALTQARDRTR